jgi:hypothetical protein
LHAKPVPIEQHDNPVDWYPGEKLCAPRAKPPPILPGRIFRPPLCYVTAYGRSRTLRSPRDESLFVNIKVDREERPDLDQIYQTAHQLLGRRGGGWPLTMFLMPDGTPFFGGTYFPKTPRYGMPGFRDLLPQIAAAYHERRADIEKQMRPAAGAGAARAGARRGV